MDKAAARDRSSVSATEKTATYRKTTVFKKWEKHAQLPSGVQDKKKINKVKNREMPINKHNTVVYN